MVPPAEVQRHLNNQQKQELARLFRKPKVMHAIRLENNSKMPVTTAPALIFGKADNVDSKGVIEQVNMLERDDPSILPGYAYSSYWYYSSYWGSYWWNQVNGISRVTWSMTLDRNDFFNGLLWVRFKPAQFAHPFHSSRKMPMTTVSW